MKILCTLAPHTLTAAHLLIFISHKGLAHWVCDWTGFPPFWNTQVSVEEQKWTVRAWCVLEKEVVVKGCGNVTSTSCTSTSNNAFNNKCVCVGGWGRRHFPIWLFHTHGGLVVHFGFILAACSGRHRRGGQCVHMSLSFCVPLVGVWQWMNECCVCLCAHG